MRTPITTPTTDNSPTIPLTGHWPECEAAARERDVLVQAWRGRWPDACEECGALGGHADSYDPSPAGVSLSAGSITDFEPCWACLAQGICPRCGTAGMPEEEAPTCNACGWTGTGQDDICPPHHECDCYERTLSLLDKDERYR